MLQHRILVATKMKKGFSSQKNVLVTKVKIFPGESFVHISLNVIKYLRLSYNAVVTVLNFDFLC